MTGMNVKWWLMRNNIVSGHSSSHRHTLTQTASNVLAPWRTKSPFQLLIKFQWNSISVVSSLSGLSDMAGPARAGDQAGWALHHPRERRQPLAIVCSPVHSDVPRSPRGPTSRARLGRRRGQGRHGSANPHRARQHSLKGPQGVLGPSCSPNSVYTVINVISRMTALHLSSPIFSKQPHSNHLHLKLLFQVLLFFHKVMRIYARNQPNKSTKSSKILVWAQYHDKVPLVTSSEWLRHHENAA